MKREQVEVLCFVTTQNNEPEVLLTLTAADHKTVEAIPVVAAEHLALDLLDRVQRLRSGSIESERNSASERSVDSESSKRQRSEATANKVEAGSHRERARRRE